MKLYPDLAGSWSMPQEGMHFKFKDLKPSQTNIVTKRLKERLEKLNLPKMYQDCDFKTLKQAMKYHGKSFLFYGTAGMGKTYLAQSIHKFAYHHNYSQANENRFNIFKSNIFIKASDLFLKFRNSFENKEVSEIDMINKYSNADLLIIDDLGNNRITDYALENLHMIIDNRYEWDRTTVITTNLFPDEMEEVLGSRIMSRLKSLCSFVEFEGKDRRE